MKRFKKAYLIIAAILVTAAVVFTSVSIITTSEQQKTGAQLDALISSFDLLADEKVANIAAMQAFFEANPNMSRQNLAVYYRNMTKLYILDFFYWENIDQATDCFVNTQIEAEISNRFDIAAWSYADIAQLYINLFTYDIAEECLQKALAYAEKCQMDDFFYEYCYTMLSSTCAIVGRSDMAMDYYQKAVEHDSEDLPEYESMSDRRSLILARLALSDKDYGKCAEILDAVGESIDAYSQFPTRILWDSGIHSPYLELRSKLLLITKDYELFSSYMEEMYITGILYDQTGGLLNYFSDLISILDTQDKSSLPPEISSAIERFTMGLITIYPKEFQKRNVQASTHIYDSNETSISLLAQRYKTDDMYDLIVTISLSAVAVILVLLIVIRQNRRAGITDALSGAYNRRSFDSAYKHVRREHSPYGMLMYDIDAFKQINDSYGHEIGDAVIKEVSKIVLGLLDNSSALYRYGGDEFCVICRRTNDELLLSLAESICSSVAGAQFSALKISVTISVGGASSKGFSHLLSAVDHNLYTAKNCGKNCCVINTPE